MIYIEPYGGLCNRMRTVASAIEMGKKFNTKVTIFWTKRRSFNCHFYSLFEPIDNVEVVKINPYFSFIRNKIKKKAICFYDEKNSEKIKRPVVRGEDIYIFSCYQFYDVNGYKCFSPVQDITDRVNKLKPFFSEHMVGVHIRRTDNVQSIINSPTELFENEIRTQIKENPLCKFYLSTDSKDEEDQLKSLFGPSIITQGEKELSRGKEEGILAAYVDLLALSHCYKIFGSFWSSFSQTAVAIGGGELIVLTKDATEQH